MTFSGLRADSSILYRLTETQAPVGHSLLGSPLFVGTLPVEISGEAADSETADGVTYCYTLYVTATDDPLFRIPETGGAGFAWLPLLPVWGLIPLSVLLSPEQSSAHDRRISTPRCCESCPPSGTTSIRSHIGQTPEEASARAKSLTPPRLPAAPGSL